MNTCKECKFHRNIFTTFLLNLFKQTSDCKKHTGRGTDARNCPCGICCGPNAIYFKSKKESHDETNN